VVIASNNGARIDGDGGPFSPRPIKLRASRCIFSIDVEDWFHIMDLPAAPAMGQWKELPSLVERNAFRLLDLLETAGVRATCFFLGWVAERHPNLVREAAARGHEVASHGYAHDLVYEISPEGFFRDVQRAKRTLEDITGKPVQGYRAPGFSVTTSTPWFFEKLVRAGYKYSSSVFPTHRQHGGFPGFHAGPCVIETSQGPIIEVPISTAKFLRMDICFFGGGYLRLFPYALIEKMMKRVLADGRPVVFYIHPREIDPQHPRLPMPFARRIKTYIGLRGTEAKLRRLLGSGSTFLPFARVLELN